MWVNDFHLVRFLFADFLIFCSFFLGGGSFKTFLGLFGSFWKHLRWFEKMLWNFIVLVLNDTNKEYQVTSGSLRFRFCLTFRKFRLREPQPKILILAKRWVELINRSLDFELNLWLKIELLVWFFVYEVYYGCEISERKRSNHHSCQGLLGLLK